MPRSPKEVLKDFGETTTAHGIGKLVGSKHPIRKTVWLVLLCVCFGYVIYQIKELCGQYKEHQITVMSHAERKKEIPFPGVTVCNLNPVRKSKIIEHNLTELLKPSGPNAIGQVEMRNKLMSMVMGMNATTRTELGHQEKDFIFGCYWLGQPCNTSFEQIFTPEYGNCFTFNSGKLHDLAVTEAGDTEGLSLLLNTEQWDYMGAVSPSIGAIVDVHHPDDIEVPAVRGITVSPGQATSIGLVLGSMYRLDSPYSKTGCKSIDTPTIYKNKIYSAEACYRGCLIAKSLEKCGCVESRMQVGLTAQTCDPFNKTLRKCIEEVVDFNSCSCPPACREMKFEFSASTSVWPSEPYWTFLKEAYDSRNTSRSFASFPDSRGNLLAVNIFFKDMSITIKTETFSYEFSNLVADVGGQLGLFVGMSVLSIMEYWELLIDLGTALLRRDKTLRVAVASKPET